MISFLFFVFFNYADSVDQIQAGKFTNKTQCSLCGGRVLCGALSESITLDGIAETSTKSVLNFCFAKTIEIQKLSEVHRPWISNESKHYLEVSDIVVKISKQKSKSKYTNEVLPSLKERMQVRANFRLENGFKYTEMKISLGAKKFKELEAKNLILPILSFESFAQVKGKNRHAYNQYAEALIAADVNDIMVDPNAFAFYHPSSHSSSPSSRNVASAASVASATKEDLGKSHDYYNTSDVDSFLEKSKLLTKEFCEKNAYKNIRQASMSSLQKLAEDYGGDTQVEKAFHYKILRNKFLNIIDGDSCESEMLLFVNHNIANLPEPKIKQKVEGISMPSNIRLPASSRTPTISKPVYCGFDINNYQENCPKK